MPIYEVMITRSRIERRFVKEATQVTVEADSPEEARRGALAAARDDEVDYVAEFLEVSSNHIEDDDVRYAVDEEPQPATEGTVPDIVNWELKDRTVRWGAKENEPT